MLVILDQAETCLLVAAPDDPNVSMDDEGNWLRERSDFERSLASLMTTETGWGGNEYQLDTGYEGFDGVLRMAVRDGAGVWRMTE